MSDTTQRAKEISSNLERRTLNRLDSLRGFADENSRPLIFGALAVALLQWAGIINLGVPDWWPLVLGITLSAAAAAYVGADKVSELIPDEDGILLVALDEQHEHGRGIYELSEDEWANLSVDGTLEQWGESHRRVYECVHYNRSENHALANWRESEPSSEILAEATPEDALAELKQLRETLEPLAADGKDLKRRLRAVAMRMDREREEASLKMMDDLEVDSETEMPTVGEILDDEVPDNLHPHAGGGSDDEQTNGHKESDQWTHEPMVDLAEIDFEDDPLLEQ